MDNKVPDVILTLSAFYEMLLNFGHSFDIEENAETFLKTLMLQNNLSFAGYYSINYPNSISKVYSIPKTNKTKYPLDEALIQAISKHQFKILNTSNPDQECINQITELLENEYLVYFTGSKSLLILGKKNDTFDLKKVYKDELVLNKFGMFMESLESHHKIKEETKIKEQQAKIIKQNNEKLIKQNEDLIKYIRSNNELEKFAYRVSHDLKAPLNTIVGFSNMFTRSSTENLTEKQLEFLKYIVDAGTQMGSLITGILDYSKINGDGLNLQRINVYQMIEKIRNLLYQSLKETNGKIIVKDVPEFIVADETKVKQLFLNLISNALKFKKPTLIPEVAITGTNCETEIKFSISDNGIGIPAESQDDIFNLFSKAHYEQNIEGQGIGLSICKQIINQHNGDIWVESEIDEGTTFHFTIQTMSMTQ